MSIATQSVGPATSRGFGALFKEFKDGLTNVQKELAAAIFPSLPGLPVGKFFDISIGIDAHDTIFPPSPLLPVPHVGMVFDLMSFIMSQIAPHIPTPPAPAEGEKMSLGDLCLTVLKAMAPSVKVHGQWVANAGTGIIHLPLLIMHAFPVVKPMSSAEMFMGSSTVLADGTPCSTLVHPALSCNIVGFWPPTRPAKPNQLIKSCPVLPTAFLTIITSSGAPVLVGGPPTVDLFQIMLKTAIWGIGKAWQALGKKLQDLINKTKNPKLAKILQKVKCLLFGDPVDPATGRVYEHNVDFELPGPIPLKWERHYYSDAEIDGPIGYNRHHSYNMGIYDMGDVFTLRHSDGRESTLPKLGLNDTYYDRKEQLSWIHEKEGYVLKNAEGLYHYFNGAKNKDGYKMLSEISKKDGAKIQFKYDGKGNLLQIIDSRKQQVNIDTNANGHICRVWMNTEDGILDLVRYKYDDAGNMTQMTDAIDASEQFLYDGHLLIQSTDPNGINFYWEYEGQGDDARCVHTWGDGGIMEYRIEYGDGVTRNRNSLGEITEYYYDEQKLIYKIVDANGGVTHRKYNDFGELEMVINPEGGVQSTVYNEFGKIAKKIDENGNSTLYDYDESLNLIEITSPKGISQQWTYNEEERVIENITTEGDKYEYHYDGSTLKYLTDSRKRKYHFQYNKLGDLEEIVFPNGLSRKWKYDRLGRILQSTDIKGNTAHFQYDKVGNLIELREPDGNIHYFEYDKFRNLIRAKDILHDVSFSYGAMGTLLSRTQNGRTVNFNYDKYTNLRAIKNEGREQYLFEIDSLGNVIKETGFDGITKRYIRDGLGRAVKVLRPGERWTNLTYDGAGNLVREEQFDGSFTAYHYDADNMLIEALNEEGALQFTRDKYGRIIKETRGDGHSIEKAFDKYGNCTRITSSLGADISRQFDEDGNLTGIRSGEVWEGDWKRDNTGLEIFRQLTGGVSVHTERDSFGREIQKSIGVNSARKSSKQYQWGMGNRLQGIYDEYTGKRTNFDYDAFDNLIKADYYENNKVDTIYRAPDAIGNLFEQKDRKDRKYNKGGRLTEDINFHYHYDCEGNLIFKEFKKQQGYSSLGKEATEKKYGIKMKASATGWLYEWSASGMLRKVVNPQQGKIRFGYDSLGRRIYKEVKKRRTCWLWDENVPIHEWQTIEEEPLIDIITWVFEDGTFVPTARITDKGSESIVTDYLGTPTQMYDANGNKTWEAQLDIYGRVRTFAGSSLSDCPFRYQGQYQDEETGLYYNRFRYYDSETGSYISQDPIGLAGSNPTLYGYVKDVNSWVDEFGLSCKKPNQDHHFATNKNKQYTPEMEKIAKKYGLKLGDDWNIASLPHQGRHPNVYHDFVLSQMKNIDAMKGMNAEKFIEQFNLLVIQPVSNNPDMLYKSFW